MTELPHQFPTNQNSLLGSIFMPGFEFRTILSHSLNIVRTKTTNLTQSKDNLRFMLGRVPACISALTVTYHHSAIWNGNGLSRISYCVPPYDVVRDLPLPCCCSLFELIHFPVSNFLYHYSAGRSKAIGRFRFPQLAHHGVVFNFRRLLGTGGGRSTQDSTKISFSNA